MTQATWILMAAIVAPLFCGLLTLIIPRKAITLRLIIALAGPITALWLLGYFTRTYGIGFETADIAWMPTLQLNLALNADHLGMFFAYLVSGIGVCIVLYARGYFGRDADSLYRFYPCLMMFMTAMLGVALSDNYMLLMLFWEMTSVSSFLLIGWNYNDSQAVRNAMQAFVVTAGGGLCMLAGLIFLGVHTGEWTITGLDAAGVANTTPVLVCFLLIFMGAATKSAQMPFQFWLPGAMAAPTPVSAYLHSATMVKAGVFIVGRFWPILAAVLPIWPMLIIPLGAMTMVYGAFVAIQKTDLKQIFAYTTVSQLGLLMTMYGLSAFEYQGEPNLIWDVTQILNHALYKAPLFILAGAIGHVATRELPDLKGFFYRDRTAKILTIFLLLAGYGLAAGPFTLSFTAKEMFFYQIYHAYAETHSLWFWPLIAAGIATGMFNVAIFIRLATTLLAKPDPQTDQAHDDHGHSSHGEHEHETGIWATLLWVPGAFIVSFQYICGIIPHAYETLFGWLESSPYYFDHFPMTWHAHLGIPLYMSLIAMTLGIALGFSGLLRKTFKDPCDGLYVQFYETITKDLGPTTFGWVQRGHAGFYIGSIMVALVALFLWSIGGDVLGLRWPDGVELEPAKSLFPGYLLTALVCFAAILLPTVIDRASRVLVLGSCGFAVSGVYYLYKAPDLALTQLSIEIVSLILFLLVLSLLPEQPFKRRAWVFPRMAIAVAVGAVMFWLTLTSTAVNRPTMPYRTAVGGNIEHLGHYFLRNAHHGMDTKHVNADSLYGGVVERPAHGEYAENQVMLHPGGGGNNVVNVILVDFRGFDTMGEITVLGLAVLGVWTLLKRRKKTGGFSDPSSYHDHKDIKDVNPADMESPPYHSINIPAPNGPDTENNVFANTTDRSLNS